MRLMMAVSSDGYAARGPSDDMRWTGAGDKAAFRLVTLAEPGPILVGSATARHMPVLPGRTVQVLSRKAVAGAVTLEWAHGEWPDALLIGGPTVAEAAIRDGMIDRAMISVVPKTLGAGVPFCWISLLTGLERVATIAFGEATIVVISRKGMTP